MTDNVGRMYRENVCKWTATDTKPGDGVLDRFVGWTEHTPGTDEEPILCVAIHATFGGKDMRETRRENAKGTIGTSLQGIPEDFETMWRIAREVPPAPENSNLVGHYRQHAL